MTLYMLDTDVCASIMRLPSEPLIRRLQATPLEYQAISVVTLLVTVLKSQPCIRGRSFVSVPGR